MSRMVFRTFSTKLLALAGLLALASGAAATTGLIEMGDAAAPAAPLRVAPAQIAPVATPVLAPVASRQVTIITTQQQANGGVLVIYTKPDGRKHGQLLDDHGKPMQSIRL